MDDLTVPVAIGAVVIAFVAVGVSLWTAVIANKTAQASLVSTFLERYGSNGMHHHLATLGDFGQNEGKSILHDLAPLAENPDHVDDEVVNHARGYHDAPGIDHEPARRDVNNFYKRAWLLHENGYLTAKALRIIARTQGYNLLFAVVRPLTFATQLIEIRGGNTELFREDVADVSALGWFAKFENFSRQDRAAKIKIDHWITWGRNYWIALVFMVGGAGVWLLLNFKWPLTLDNMAWHPNLVTVAAGFLGIGMGRLLPVRPHQ